MTTPMRYATPTKMRSRKSPSRPRAGASAALPSGGARWASVPRRVKPCVIRAVAVVVVIRFVQWPLEPLLAIGLLENKWPRSTARSPQHSAWIEPKEKKSQRH